MKDDFGRTIDYVRVSVTDRCSLRCAYCMPKSGVPSFSHSEILTLEELHRLCGLFARLGTTRLKVSGGEPLVRLGIIPFIKAVKKLQGIEQVTLTTNGLALEENLPALIGAGLGRVNISLDTLDAGVFAKLTGSKEHAKVMRAIDACLRSDVPVRLNCVPLGGVNGGELVKIAELAKDKPIDVRFIELMPVGLGAKFEYIPSEKVREMISGVYGQLVPSMDAPGNGPARYFAVPGFKGRVGFISAMSHAFCEKCNRIRLTSDGRLVLCLSHDVGADLKTPLRAGATDTELMDIIMDAVKRKPAAHSFGTTVRDAAMNSIGG